MCETTTWPGAFHVTEKTLRPMYYKRPFLVVGSKDYLKNLRAMGFRTFDNIISTAYDQTDGLVRVDRVFETLEQLIDQGIDDILDQCHDDIEHNHNLLLELSTKHLHIKKENPGYYKHD